MATRTASCTSQKSFLASLFDDSRTTQCIQLLLAALVPQSHSSLSCQSTCSLEQKHQLLTLNTFSVATQLNCTQLRHKRLLWCQQRVISCHPQHSNTSSSSHQRFQFHNMECFGIHPLPLVTPLGLRGAWLSLLSILPLHTLMK